MIQTASSRPFGRLNSLLFNGNLSTPKGNSVIMTNLDASVEQWRLELPVVPLLGVPMVAVEGKRAVVAAVEAQSLPLRLVHQHRRLVVERQRRD